jgi:hypothetical protein
MPFSREPPASAGDLAFTEIAKTSREQKKDRIDP